MRTGLTRSLQLPRQSLVRYSLWKVWLMPIQSFGRINHHSLRRLETLAGFQRPGKAFRMNAQKHSRDSVGVHIDLAKKIAAVYQAETEDFALLLIRVGTLQRQERIELMAAVSSHAVDFLGALSQSVPCGHNVLSPRHLSASP